MEIFIVIIGIVYIVGKLIAAAVEDSRPSGETLDNKAMFNDSVIKGMSSKELKRNYKNGKYFK